MRSISFSSWLTRLIWVVIAVAVPAAIWALIYIPSWQVGRVLSEGASARAVFELENEARRTMAQIVLGVFGLLALFVTWRRTRAAEKAVEVAESGQQTERFTKAIEQLGATDDKGNPRLEIRLGGIYALERLARDSEDQDYWTIMEVLTAYVRQNAVYVEEDVEEKGETSVDDGDEPRRALRIDIQAILTVLGRREKIDSEKQSLDLSGADLRGGLFRGLRLGGACLTGARLDAADFSEAQMEGAYMFRAHLNGAILRAAHLEKAHLRAADLVGADLWCAHLDAAILTYANLQRATLMEAHLEGALMWGAHMEGAHLMLASLEGANLRDAHLQSARLNSAKLRGAGLEGADLRGAHLEGADLRSTDVTAEQLAVALGDGSTLLPERMLPPDKWPK